MYRAMASVAVCLGCCAASVPASVQLFQPDGATATSEFSIYYDIGNAIDGSGLPPDFGPSDAHADYVADNHWTTAANQVPGAAASFFFDTPQTIGAFYLWNHRSNVIASNPHYEVTRFDLELFDAASNSLRLLDNLTAVGESATAQEFVFSPTGNVSRVVFTIESNQGFEQGADPNYTGVGEVAFAVPEPSAALGGLGAAFLLLRRRRHVD